MLYSEALMLAIRLPQSIEKRLEELARRTGRTKTYYVREAILEHLEDLEDMYLAKGALERIRDRKSTRLNSSHEWISYAVFCLKKNNSETEAPLRGPQSADAQRELDGIFPLNASTRLAMLRALAGNARGVRGRLGGLDPSDSVL